MPETDLLKSKICLVGERGVGKSSLIRRYVLDQFDDNIGHVGFRQLLGDSFFNGAQGILAVADLTRHETLPVLTGWVEAVESVAGKVPVILVANKADLTGQAQIGVADLAEMAETFGCTYVLTSAKNGQNVEDAFLRLATQIAKARVPGDRVQVAKPS